MTQPPQNQLQLLQLLSAQNRGRTGPSAGTSHYVFKAGSVAVSLPRHKRAAALALGLYQPARRFAKASKLFVCFANRAGMLRFVLPKCGIKLDPSKGYLLTNSTKPFPAIIEVDADKMTVTKHGLPGSGVADEGAKIETFNKTGVPGIANILHRGADENKEWFETPYYPPANLRTLLDRRVETLLLSWLGAGFFHGDFAPWNLRVDLNNKLIAVDLEWSVLCSGGRAVRPGIDLCYGLLREALLVRRLVADAADKWVLESAGFFAEYMCATGWDNRLGEWLQRGKEYYATR